MSDNHFRKELEELSGLYDDWNRRGAKPIARTVLRIVNRLHFRKASKEGNVLVSLPLINALVEIEIDETGLAEPYVEISNPEIAHRLDWEKEKQLDPIFSIDVFAEKYGISEKAFEVADSISFQPVSDGGIMVIVDDIQIRVAPDGTFIYLCTI